MLLRGNGGFVDMRNGNTRGNHLLKTTNLLRGHTGENVPTKVTVDSSYIRDLEKKLKVLVQFLFCGPLTIYTDGDRTGSCCLVQTDTMSTNWF